MKQLLATSLLVFLPALAVAAPQTFDVTVQAGKTDRSNDPVTISLALPAELAKGPVQLTDSAGKAIPAQLTNPSLLASPGNPQAGQVPREVHFILPSLKAGETARFKLTVGGSQPTPQSGFTMVDKPGESSEIQFQGRPILRYMCQPIDESNKEKRELTYKVYHHLYDPAGSRLVTKGPGGQYTHHRGIFYAFNKVTYGEGKKCDIWHCPNASQEHEKFLSTETGPVLARQRIEIRWHGMNKEVFGREEREMTVYNVLGGTLVEFASLLRSADGKPIQLDGDPQHAGFHFRADNEVSAKTNKQTIYVRPDGAGKPGETRNWDPKTRKGPTNLPWDAMSFVLGEKRYTAAYLDKPSNPKEARFSERDYGRFGSYFEYEVTKEKPLRVNYRIWLQEGQMTPEQVASLDQEFVEPVTAMVK